MLSQFRDLVGKDRKNEGKQRRTAAKDGPLGVDGQGVFRGGGGEADEGAAIHVRERRGVKQ